MGLVAKRVAVSCGFRVQAQIVFNTLELMLVSDLRSSDGFMASGFCTDIRA